MENAYAQALYTAIMRGTDHKKAVNALNERLEREGRTALIPRISHAFARIALREGRKSRARLVVARESDVTKARQGLESLIGNGAHEVAIDPTLIGGWRVEKADTLVDASYKHYLLDLYNRVTV